MDDLTDLRRRVEELQDELDRLEARPPNGATALVVEIIQEAALPTEKELYFACKVLDVGGPEEEGGAATFDDAEADVIYAVCLGPGIPQAGDKVLVSIIQGGRWGFGC